MKTISLFFLASISFTTLFTLQNLIVSIFIYFPYETKFFYSCAQKVRKEWFQFFLLKNEVSFQISTLIFFHPLSTDLIVRDDFGKISQQLAN